MTMTYFAVAALSVINIVIACINLYTTGRAESIADRLDAINTRINIHDKAIKGAYESIEEERDCLFELNDDLKELKKKAERTHNIALYAYNAVKNNEYAWKHASKAMEESEEREDHN